jgi:cysteine-rich repeat protein
LREATMKLVAGLGSGLLLTLLGAAIGCDNEPRCGDGLVDTGEVCDDGNPVSGDGCSAACQPDDDLRTPGDDRAGYFICSEPLGPAITCGPGTVCCVSDGPTCVSAEQGCVDVYNVTSCDGPEDCPGNYHCETQSHGTSCTSSEGSKTWCHTDDDCVPFMPWFGDGPCTASGACDFAIIPPDQVEL